MPITGRPKAALVMTDDERRALMRLTTRARANRSLAFRARLVLACADGATNTAVARRYRTTNATVGLWRQRFVDLYDEPRVGAPRTISDEAVEAVIVQTLETTPVGETHWSTRTMAAKAGMSHTTVGRIWRTFGLKPHVTESFKISPDPQLIEKVRDVVGLYMNPPTNAAVFSFDEKSQIQALERAQPILPMDIGQPERRTHNYIRNGTLLQATASRGGFRRGSARDRRERRRRARGARRVGQPVAHRAPLVHRWLLRHPRFHLHFTPTYASWLNLVERFFAMLTEKALRRGSHTSVLQLRDAILAYVAAHNATGKPFIWTKTADEILDKMRRFGLRTQQVHG